MAWTIALLLALAATRRAEDPAAALKDYLARCERFGFSGSVLVVARGEVLVREGFGFADREAGTPCTPSTLFEIASLSKPFTAAAVLALEAKGKLSLDDPISKHLHDVPARHADVTIRHLLHHTAGFPRMGPAGGGPDRDAAVAAYLRGNRPRAAGTRFEYWNGGYALLAAIVERASGEDFRDVCRREVFRGLEATGFCGDPFPAGAPLAVGYEGSKRVGRADEHSFGWEYRGMGGVVTNLDDLRRWDRALGASGKLFEPALEDYACGWWVTKTPRGTRCIQHGGTVEGFECEMMRFPEDRALIVVLANRGGVGWQVAYTLRALLFGDEPHKVPLPPETAGGDVARFAGTYEDGSGVRLLLRAEGGRLVAGASGQASLLCLGGAGAAFEAERARAARIIEGLAKGDIAPLQEKLLPQIPRAWPGIVRDILWPRHLAEWGALRSFEEIGALPEPRAGRVRVWVRLRHEKGDTAVEIAFLGEHLNILDLHGREFPWRAVYLPAPDGTLVNWDFGRPPAPPLVPVLGEGGVVEAVRVGDAVLTRVRPAR